ncbi:MAG: hypothetical protein ACKVWV_01900 [Planctomycetota bacterium]
MTPTVDTLDFRILDAEYSASLERIVAVSAAPQNRLHIYDPIAQSGVAVPLSLPPLCVGVSPDGLRAAVGHDAWVTIVDLTTATVLNTYSVPAIAFDIVLSANGFAYVMPLVDQWVTIKCLNTATGAVTNSTGGSIRAGTKMRAHPGGSSIYGANNGLSPSDIERYSIVSGTLQRLYDSPYHGDYAMCGDLWITADGLRILTKCGNTFRASPVQSEDMTYIGALPGVSGVAYANHSVQTNKILVIASGATNDRKLRIHDAAFLGFDGEVSLPTFPAGPGNFPSHGRFVFHDAAGTRAFTVVQADPTSGLILDSGIATYTFPGGCTGSWSNYCTSTPNSTGVPATIELTGSLGIAANDSWVRATNCPPNAIGIFIFGGAQGLVPFGDGYLCFDLFGPGLHRLFRNTRVGPTGIAELKINFPYLPATTPIPAGSTQNFQFWFRDAQGPGGQGFNTSNAAQATFCN